MHLNDPRRSDMVRMRRIAPISCCHILVKLQTTRWRKGVGESPVRMFVQAKRKLDGHRILESLEKKDSNGQCEALTGTKKAFQKGGVKQRGERVRMDEEVLSPNEW